MIDMLKYYPKIVKIIENVPILENVLMGAVTQSASSYS